MQFHSQLRRRLRLNLLFWILFICIGLSVFVISGWKSATKEAGEQSENDIATASLILKQSIVDGSKLLDLIKKDVQPLVLSSSPSQKEFESVLTKSLQAFSVHFDISKYGILYLIDGDGKLIARSDNQPLLGINLSDRHFYKKLKNDPNADFIVASLIKSRTTNKSIVSLVAAIKNPKGKFLGALGLQMDPAPLEHLLSDHMRQHEETLSVISDNDEIILTVPLSSITPNSKGGIPFKDAALLAFPQNDKWFEVDDQIVAKTTIPEIGISVISQISISKVWQKFVMSNLLFFSFLLAMAAIFTILFYFLNKKILEADDARLHSMIDGLTLLPNRRAFDEAYEKFLKDARRNEHPVSILFIDIDHFKRCNDTFGHENGDIVLKRVADLIQKCMRRPFDFCCRWGGEEIVCLLPDTDLNGASKLAEIILKTIENDSISIKGFPPINVTVSIGISSASHREAMLENNLVDKADQAMYRAKQNGRNRYSS